MSKYSEPLKEYNKGKDKLCIPKKGSDDYKLILKIMEKNENKISSSPKSQKVLVETKVKVPKICPEGTVLNPKTNRCNKIKVHKEPKVKVPKEPKVKVPKICPEGTVLNPKTNRCNKIKVHKEPKVKVPKEPNVKVPKICPEGTVLNPKTNRCNKIKVHKEPKEPIVKLSSVSKKSKNENIINFPISMKLLSDKKYSKSSVKSSKKTSRVFIKQVNSKQNVNIIANFLRNKLIKDKYTLDNRVSFYKYINNLLVDINGDECLESKVFKSRKGYTINNKINLYKKIGTESVNGAIYLTSIMNSFGGFTIASKVMNDDLNNTNEIKIMKFITDELILTKKSRHFALMYKHAICNKVPFVDKHRIVCVNELAHGDIKTLLENVEILKDDELMMNLFFQTFISLGTFHNMTGYVHKDAHYGNFLYQRNNEKGYYEYSFNGKSYYLKSCGYNVMIYDFGLSTGIEYLRANHKYHYVLMDYARIIHAFFNKKYGGWIEYNNLPSDYVNDALTKIKKIAFETDTKIDIKVNDKSIEDKVFEYIIEKIFIPFSPKGLWLTQRPDNVINKIAFVIR